MIKAALDPKPVTPEEWDRREKEVLGWAKARPDSTTARLAYAELLSSRAWSIRGGAYARDVPKDAWKPFREHLLRARRYLEAEKRIASRSPSYYAQRIVYAKGLGDVDEAKAAFDEGMARFPGYYPMYFAMLDFLLPKWHGGPKEIERFARDATRRTQAAEGEGMYARIYWYAAQSDYEDDLFWTSFARWEQMRAGFEDVVSRYPDQWNIQNFAHFACQAEDAETLRGLFDRIMPPIIADAWKGSSSYETCGRMAGRMKL